MARKNKVGRCVHCLKDDVELTSDHMFPKAWYPATTPANLEKWQFPACYDCNNHYSKIERDLLNRFALALDVTHPASAGLIEAALRGMDPNAGHNERDVAAREARLKKISTEMYKGEAIPDDQIIPGLGERWGRPKAERIGIDIPRAGMDEMTKKIVRGLVYREDRRFIETPYDVEAFVDNDGAEMARTLIEQAGAIFKREPGLEIRRAVIDGDHRMEIYEISFWGQFKTYAMVQKTGIPLGYYLLERRERVKAGDHWCHQGKVHRVWLPVKLFGAQQPYNDYGRKLDLSQT